MQKYPTGTKRAFFNPDQLALYVGAGQRANVETALNVEKKRFPQTPSQQSNYHNNNHSSNLDFNENDGDTGEYDDETGNLF